MTEKLDLAALEKVAQFCANAPQQFQKEELADAFDAVMVLALIARIRELESRANRPGSGEAVDMVTVPATRLKHARNELDACQKAIWYAGGFDPAYCEGAQASIKEIDEWLCHAVLARGKKGPR